MDARWESRAFEQHSACRNRLGGAAAKAVALVRAGDRRAAAEIWERELQARPEDFRPARNLAILYYWWARQEEADGGAARDRLWMAAIERWTGLAASDAFWIGWREELSRRWGIAVAEADLRPVRDGLIEGLLLREFESYTARYKEQGRAADAERHEEYLTYTLLALRGSRPGSDSLGRISVWIEERGLPEVALAKLDALPESERRDPEARALRVRALLAAARRLQGKRLTSEALGRAEAGWGAAQETGLAIPEAGDLLDSLAKEESARLKQENRSGDAADLLERLFELSKRPAIREYACLFRCDRGFQKLGEREYDGARREFMRALRLDNGYTRARQAVAAAYHSEALEKRDPEAKLKLLQKAVEYNPDDRGAREDLGAAFHEKGLRIVRETNAANAKLELARAIGLFRAAATALNPELTDETLDAIVRAADPGAGEIRNLPEGLYRTTLEHVASAARHRKQVRSE